MFDHFMSFPIQQSTFISDFFLALPGALVTLLGLGTFTEASALESINLARPTV